RQPGEGQFLGQLAGGITSLGSIVAVRPGAPARGRVSCSRGGRCGAGRGPGIPGPHRDDRAGESVRAGRIRRGARDGPDGPGRRGGARGRGGEGGGVRGGRGRRGRGGGGTGGGGGGPAGGGRGGPGGAGGPRPGGGFGARGGEGGVFLRGRGPRGRPPRADGA